MPVGSLPSLDSMFPLKIKLWRAAAPALLCALLDFSTCWKSHFLKENSMHYYLVHTCIFWVSTSALIPKIEIWDVYIVSLKFEGGLLHYAFVNLHFMTM